MEYNAKWGQKYVPFDHFKNYISDWCGGENCFGNSCKFQAVLSHACVSYVPTLNKMYLLTKGPPGGSMS
jgi:hypothetical protein